MWSCKRKNIPFLFPYRLSNQHMNFHKSNNISAVLKLKLDCHSIKAEAQLKLRLDFLNQWNRYFYVIINNAKFLLSFMSE